MDNLPDLVKQAHNQVHTPGLPAGPHRLTFCKLLTECFAEFSKVYILIDAFDECADEERATIMRDLQQVSESKLKLFITSRTGVEEDQGIRDDPELKECLRKADVKQISASPEDVEMYLTERIQVKARSLDEDLKQQVIRTIISQMDGQYHNYRSVNQLMFRFLLADFQLSVVLGHRCQPKKLKAALCHLPTNLDGLYGKIMQQIHERRNETEKDLAVRSLSWIFHTPRPLRTEELLELLATDETDNDVVSESDLSSPEDLVNVCHGLVTLDIASGTVR